MSLYLRLLITICTSFFNSKKHPALDPIRTNFRVLPNDLDILGHVNNGRYLTLMDLGRINLIGRSGLAKKMLPLKWYPLIGSVTMTYFRPLKMLQKYQIQTRLICWDEKWFFLEQKFLMKEFTVAIGIVRAQIHGPKGRVSPDLVLSLISDGTVLVSPKAPDWIEKFVEVQDQIARQGKSQL
jgi:acyl-CoA thioesterase FadM